MKRKLRQILIARDEIKRDSYVTENKKFEKKHLEAEIIRLVHSIEKGLCLENPRKGFGVAKINTLFSLADKYLSLNPDDYDCMYFIADSVKEYLDFHERENFENEEILAIKNKYDALKSRIPEKDDVYGGIGNISLSEMEFDLAEIEKLFNTRHSIREYSGESVDEETLKKAIALAQRSPSACNRQGVRVYSVDREKFLNDMEESLDGIGGFAQDVDKFLIITGKQSAYRVEEKNQYVVSASMFAGYLTLALHAYNIASCVIQRSLRPRAYWTNFRIKNGIPEDEQIVMLIGIGKYKEETKVPMSKRFSVDKIYRK